MIDFIALSLTAFSLSLAVHYLAANWMLSLLLGIGTTLIGGIILLRLEGIAGQEKQQSEIAIYFILSIFGGVIAWAI